MYHIVLNLLDCNLTGNTIRIDNHSFDYVHCVFFLHILQNNGTLYNIQNILLFMGCIGYFNF